MCSTSDHYFDDEAAMECIACPAVHERIDLPIGIVGGLLVLLWLSWLCRESCGERLHGLIATVKRVVARIQQLDLVPRCKLLFTFFQVLAVRVRAKVGVERSANSKSKLSLSLSLTLTLTCTPRRSHLKLLVSTT